MLTKLIVALGILIMIYALSRCKKCLELVPEASYVRYWKALALLTGLFISGYIFFEYALFTNISPANERLVLSLVLLLGAVFVVLVTNLTYEVFCEVTMLQAETQSYAERLEDEVKRRTLQLEEMAITDSLTGLYNQRYLFNKLDEELARAQRQKSSLFLILFDIDDFKQFNDRDGHLTGDHILQTVGAIVATNIRDKVDSAFRYGGDEFTILLPDTNQRQALTVAKRIMQELAKYGLSISIGITYHADYFILSPKDLLNVADKAMYEAKAEGGNRIRVMKPLATPQRPFRIV